MMAKTTIVPWHILVTLLITTTIMSGVAENSFAQKTKRALLIGIDDYKSSSVRDLRGCGNDVELMRNILIGKFDVPGENVKGFCRK